VTGPDLMEMATAYQRSAVVAAACETGVAAAIAERSASPAAIAAEHGLDPRGVRALLGAMRGLGLAERDGAGFRLSEAGAPLAPGHRLSVAPIVAKEWFFYRAWAGLPQTVRDGHARIAPWRERLAADPDTALDFLRALDDLAAMFGGGLPELAGVPGPGRLLDVGGGSGAHAAALAAATPGLEAVVLDLEPVGALVAERHPELGFVTGDLEAPRFGRPAGELWDVVLVANVLHDVPEDAARRIVGAAAGLLRPGGLLVAYEWLLDEDGAGPPDVAMFALMMMVENEGGDAYPASEIEAWMAEAGLEGVETRRGAGPIAAVRGRRP
jgi:3-hydroxy-5-methyl-1-naphthoate 3-O-methyltransferase